VHASVYGEGFATEEWKNVGRITLAVRAEYFKKTHKKNLVLAVRNLPPKE